MLVTYWSRAVYRYLGEVKQSATTKYSELSRFFTVDGFQAAGLPKILAILSERKEIMLLKNLDVDVSMKLQTLKPEDVQPSKDSNGEGVFGVIKNLFFNRLQTEENQTTKYSIRPETFVVSTKLLEYHIEKYLVKDLALLRTQLFKDRLFVNNQEIHDFMESHGDSVEDSYLIVHSLAERGIIHSEKQKDKLGRVMKGYVLHNTK